jgi:DNA topoisomerase-1
MARRKQEPSFDPVDSAQAAGLRYVSDTMPGIRRRRAGSGFTYLTAEGRPVREKATLARIRSLAIPPAYTDVWICPTPNGHLQATGRDARGRKQYRYHPRWREVRDETKFGRMLAFSEALPRVRRRVEEDDRSQAGPPREKCSRPSSACSNARAPGRQRRVRPQQPFFRPHHLQDHHVEISGSTMRFEFGARAARHTAWP